MAQPSHPYLGALVRIHRAELRHTMVFYVLAITFPIIGVVGLLASAETLRYQVYTGMGCIIGCPLALLGYQNSKNSLAIYERGIRVTSPRGASECRYADIFEIELESQTAHGYGVTMITGLIVRFRDGTILKSKVIRNPEEAAKAIQAKMSGA